MSIPHAISDDLCDQRFGATARCLFHISDYTNFNHGSFGQCPRDVLDAQRAYSVLAEQHNDRWFRDTYYKLTEKSRACIAALIKSNLNDVVLVENASSAVNGILRSLPMKSGEKVLILSQAYNMVKEVLLWIKSSKMDIEIVTVNLQYPISSPDHIVSQARKALEAFGPQIRLCIYSHVSSMPSMIEPVEDLVRISRELTEGRAAILLDAAHCPGHVDIDVGSIDADFYLGNLHKWMFAPKGSAFLWARPGAAQDMVQPTVISSTGNRDFVGRFAYTGTRDYSSFCSIVDAFDFIEKNFGSYRRCRDYNHSLVVRGCRMLAEAWGTMLLCDESMVGAMCNVELPCTNKGRVEAMQMALDRAHDIYVVYGRVPRAIDSDYSVSSAADTFNPAFPSQEAEPASGGGRDDAFIYFLRLSGAVYLDSADFDKLRDIVPSLLK